jgi:hypothetical protein
MLNRTDLEGLSPEFIAWVEGTGDFNDRFERLALRGVHTKMLLDWLYAAYFVGKGKGI